jgi:hypothetical protein
VKMAPIGAIFTTGAGLGARVAVQVVQATGQPPNQWN